MIPVRFGGEEREMLGFYHPAARALASAPAVLICSPFGPEAIRSYRMQRLLGDRLAAKGCPVLRFDYHGTGDSPGADEVASLVGWAGDIGLAHRELMTRSGKNRVAWIGVRLGASLCAMAAQSSRPGLDLIVLWDPIINGEQYLEIYRSQTVQPPRDAFESMGFEFPDRFRNELRAFKLAELPPITAGSASVLIGTEDNASAALRGWLDRSGTKADWTVSHAVAEWNSERALNTAAIPAQLLQIVESRVLQA